MTLKATPVAVKAPAASPFPEATDSRLFSLKMAIWDAIERAQIDLLDQPGAPARARLDAISRLDRGQRTLMAQASKLRRDLDDILNG